MTRFISIVVLALAATQTAHGFGRGGGGGGQRGGYQGGAQRGGFQGGGAAQRPQPSSYSRPPGATSSGNRSSSTHTTQNGSTIQTGHASGSASNAYGGRAAGSASAMKVTTPTGQTYSTGRYGAAGQGAYGGTAATAGRGSAVSGSQGSAAWGSKGTAGTTPYGGSYATRSGGAVATNGQTTAAAGYRGGAASTPYGNAAAYHGTSYYRPSTLPATGAVVRSQSYGAYNAGWYSAHPTAWRAPGVAAVVAVPTYTAIASTIGIAAPPAIYDYGSNVVIADNSVMVDGETVATAPEYAAQASTFADAGRNVQPAAQDEWQPLGVFGLVQEGDQAAQRIFQLAVNKSGVIRGNYTDTVDDTTLPIYGSLDKASQRAAWSIGDKKEIVYETGLDNLTKDQAACLVHQGKDRTLQMLLVRLPEGK